MFFCFKGNDVDESTFLVNVQNSILFLGKNFKNIFIFKNFF